MMSFLLKFLVTLSLLTAGNVFCDRFTDIESLIIADKNEVLAMNAIDEEVGNDCLIPEVNNGYVYANGVLLASKAVVLPGTEIRISCWNNTVLFGNGKACCSSEKGQANSNRSEEWQPRLGNCIKHSGCGKVPVVSGGTIDLQGPMHLGATRLIRCYDGYILTGASFIRCKNDMTWSQPGTCLPLPVMSVVEVTQCKVPEIPNGRIFTIDGQVAEGTILLSNTEVRLGCRPGYLITGNSSSLCSSWDGKWVPTIGSCVEQLKCGKVPVIVGGSIDDGNSSVGSIRLMKCAENFYLHGRSYIKCLPNVTWSQPGFCGHQTTFGALPETTPTLVPFMIELRKAAQGGSASKMMELLEAGRNVNDVTHPPNAYPHFCRNVWTIQDPNPLRLAAACNRSVDSLRVILEEAPQNVTGKIDDKNGEGFTALMYAADNGNLEAVKLLVDHGADVNARNEEGYTPLIYAAWGGSNRTVTYLLDSGAQVNARNKRGYTALILAAHQGYTDIVCQLLERGAHINARNSLGHTALIYSARFGYEDIVKLLLGRGASIRGCRYQLCKPSSSFELSRSFEENSSKRKH